MPCSSDWHIPTRGIFTWENCLTNISSIWDIFQLSCLAILFPPHSLHCTVEKQRHLTSALDWELQMLKNRSIFFFSKIIFFFFFFFSWHWIMETNLISALFSEYICIKGANLGGVSYMTQKPLHTVAKNSHELRLFIYLL